ncbi:MAG: response regulator [Armatimonadetes bacterium]|nr:response regulator [Armatimonadota bacterium]
MSLGVEIPMATIVFADDDPSFRFLLAAYLQLLGHRVRSAGTGRQALELVADEQPSLVILDLVMPDLDGYQTCRALRTDPATAGIPVMLLTAFEHFAQSPRAAGTWFDAVLSKPCRMDELRYQIDSLLCPVAVAA